MPQARQFPKPVQLPHPPIHVGGESNAALRRAARLAEGWYGYNLDPSGAAERVGKLRTLIAEAGRAPSDVLVSVSPYMHEVTEREVEAYAEAGVDQLVLYAPIRSTEDAAPVLRFAIHRRTAVGAKVPELVGARAVGFYVHTPGDDDEVVARHEHVCGERGTGRLAAHAAMAVIHVGRLSADLVADPTAKARSRDHVALPVASAEAAEWAKRVRNQSGFLAST